MHAENQMSCILKEYGTGGSKFLVFRKQNWNIFQIIITKVPETIRNIKIRKFLKYCYNAILKIVKHVEKKL